MAKFIIIKYASLYQGKDGFDETDSVAGSYTAKQCGVEKTVYDSVEEGQSDLSKMKELNPTVDYGLVPII